MGSSRHNLVPQPQLPKRAWHVLYACLALQVLDLLHGILV